MAFAATVHGVMHIDDGASLASKFYYCTYMDSHITDNERHEEHRKQRDEYRHPH